MGKRSLDNVHVDELLDRARETGSGDLYLRHGLPPFTGLSEGRPLSLMSEYAALSPLDIQQMVYGVLTDEQIHQFERDGESVFSYNFGRKAKFAARLVHSAVSYEAEFRQV